MIHDLDSEESQSSLECQLEDAFDTGYQVIIIEPIGLGDQAIRWIKVGNFLHKTAVITSLGSLITFCLAPPQIALLLGGAGVVCACVYDFSWQFDPCCKYQVDYRGKDLVQVPSHEILSRTPVVLVRRNDKYRKILHNTLALLVVGCVGWNLYKRFY